MGFFTSLCLNLWQIFWGLLRGRGLESLELQASVNQKAAGKYSKGHADEVSDGKESSLGNWSRDHPCFLVAESLASLCPCPEASRKTELPSARPAFLAGEIAKQQSVQAAAWLLLRAYSQMREQRDRLKTKLIKKKTERCSQRASHLDLKRNNFPEQAPAKKIKADKQRLSVLNPGNKKDSSRGPQKRAAKLPGRESEVVMPPGPVVVKPKKSRQD